MDEQELKQAVAEILEISPEELREDAELDSFEAFDSTARLSLMVCLSDFAGVPMELGSLERIRTYGDVLALARSVAGNGRRP